MRGCVWMCLYVCVGVCVGARVRACTYLPLRLIEPETVMLQSELLQNEMIGCTAFLHCAGAAGKPLSDLHLHSVPPKL